MSLEDGRYTPAAPPDSRRRLDPGKRHPAQPAVWRQRVAHRSGRPVYVAQVTGSQISALDLGNGWLDTVSAKGGDIIAPDDVAFDP